jgi:hypothetical protein
VLEAHLVAGGGDCEMVHPRFGMIPQIMTITAFEREIIDRKAFLFIEEFFPDVL